jgi:hypothetical protein
MCGTAVDFHSGDAEAFLRSCTSEQGAARCPWSHRRMYLPVAQEATLWLPWRPHRCHGRR